MISYDFLQEAQRSSDFLQLHSKSSLLRELFLIHFLDKEYKIIIIIIIIIIINR